MHIEGPYLTTTSTRKRKEKITKSMQAELERGWRERNVRLREINLPKESLQQYTEWVHGRGKKTKTTKLYVPLLAMQASEPRRPNTTPVGKEPRTVDVPSPRNPVISSLIDGGCTKKPSPVYTGTKMIGIAQMSKSNAVPVFSNEEIINIARMRR
jgi:hypothetical protein